LLEEFGVQTRAKGGVAAPRLGEGAADQGNVGRGHAGGPQEKRYARWSDVLTS
jgi:hypothetical protein